ncbi:MAG: tyrosine-type recombinase/integrase [Candidatus Melainabacteria bacterium]|nr:tyrosine-type recombinase/integrase [Candidatus Melainabacteria bacterium]
MFELLTLEDIAKDLGKSVRTIQRLAKNGLLPIITQTRKGGFYYSVPVQAYLEWKKQWFKNKKEENYLCDRDFLDQQQNEWLLWCSKGLLTGKPLSERTVEIYKSYLNLYWKLLPRRYTKSALISLDSLRKVLVGLDVKSYSTKKNIYDAIRSFTKYLIARGFAQSEISNELQKIRPKRVYPPKRLHCTQEQFYNLVNSAGKKCSGQSNYDAIFTKALIMTLGLTGLRASELCNLKMQDIDLIQRRLFVFLGKGKKSRWVGINEQLYNQLIDYLSVRPKTTLEQFFVTNSRVINEVVPLNRKSLAQKISRLSNRAGIKISAHGLRRTFATVAANSGKPINIISLALGHADLKTTQGYLMTSQDEVIKEMQGW